MTDASGLRVERYSQWTLKIVNAVRPGLLPACGSGIGAPRPPRASEVHAQGAWPLSLACTALRALLAVA